MENESTTSVRLDVPSKIIVFDGDRDSDSSEEIQLSTILANVELDQFEGQYDNAQLYWLKVCEFTATNGGFPYCLIVGDLDKFSKWIGIEKDNLTGALVVNIKEDKNIQDDQCILLASSDPYNAVPSLTEGATLFYIGDIDERG